MTNKMNIEELNEREWEKIAPGLSDSREIDTDKAWNKVWSRMNESGAVTSERHNRFLFIRSNLMKAAAAILLLIGLGTAAIYVVHSDMLSRKTVIATGADEKNHSITLPDGSLITLNRNSEITYLENFGKRNRKVTLAGEAFFEISADPSKSFTIDAGQALVRVVGTSFNVKTENSDSAVEVYVQSGTVMLSDNDGKNQLMVEAGYVGTVDPERAEKSVNSDPNYMAWHTEKLVYDGQTLDIVFRDLKKVYNMDVIPNDPSILTNAWTSPIDIQSRDTIIRLICTSFNLSYSKDGNEYHLSKK